jgi:hypothetical protein
VFRSDSLAEPPVKYTKEKWDLVVIVMELERNVV